MTPEELCERAIQKGMECTVHVDLNPVNPIHGTLVILLFAGIFLAAALIGLYALWVNRPRFTTRIGPDGVERTVRIDY